MPDVKYALLGLISLDAGSWADWFAGTMSFAAVATSLAGYWIVNRQRVADIEDRQRQIAEAIGWKVTNLFNDTAAVSRHLRTCLDHQFDPRFSMFKYMRVPPLSIPASSKALLTQEEVTLLLKAKAASTLMLFTECSERYQSLSNGMQEYKIKHETLYEKMPSPETLDGTIFSHRLNTDEKKKIMPYAKMLEHLLENLIDLASENLIKCEEVLSGYDNAMRAQFPNWKLDIIGSTEGCDLTLYQSMPLPAAPC